VWVAFGPMEGAGSKPEVDSPEGGGEKFNLLVLAAETLSGGDLRDEIRRHAGEREAAVRVVVPALVDSKLKHALGEVDAAIDEASKRLDGELAEARQAGIDIEGQVGDSDPILAIEDALLTFPADEILVVTHDEQHAHWLEADLFERAKQRFEPPLTHVVVEGEGAGSHARETEHAGRGTEGPSDAELESHSGNIPRLSIRDVAGIVIAIVGSIAAILIATSCPGGISEGEGTSTACVIELILAGGISLINIAHVVALTMMQGMRYRGWAERYFATISLVGTPLVIAANLIISATAG
jgi:hypothetical protein